ncbi:hypothetical protein QTQ03_08345 [Micromonospora sp. WMMA1363]|uniref:DUF7489 domain-containing protein n=1 Tax=Micromonospora sp. WMMA1363 TaxID=3053985 RepID=UPI00259D06E7|nr:hypothetical protein [Micromonospora sp. WMMA1363]MDM4719597.1 hypothetical protein [Micromonospora sp. WMMA1363]
MTVADRLDVFVIPVSVANRRSRATAGVGVSHRGAGAATSNAHAVPAARGVVVFLTTFEAVALLGILAGLLYFLVLGAQTRAAMMDQEFTGVVMDYRERHTTLNTGVRHDYVLTVRTVDGELIEFVVDPHADKGFKFGDLVVKRRGERWPVKG